MYGRYCGLCASILSTLLVSLEMGELMRLCITRYEGVVGVDREEYNPWNIDVRGITQGFFAYKTTSADSYECHAFLVNDVEGIKRPQPK